MIASTGLTLITNGALYAEYRRSGIVTSTAFRLMHPMPADYKAMRSPPYLDNGRKDLPKLLRSAA